MQLYFVFYVHTQSLSHVHLTENPRTAACQTPLSLEFPRRECWSSLSFLLQGISQLRDQTLASCIGRWLLCYWATWEAQFVSSVQFSHSVMSDSLQPHGLQNDRLPCPSPTPGAYSTSYPLSWWCHPTISSPSPLAFNVSRHQGIFQWVCSLHQVEFQLQYQSFQWTFRTDFLYDWLVWSPCSPRNCQEFSSIPLFKSINILVFTFLVVQLSHLYMATGKTIALTRVVFVGKVTSLLFIRCLG